MPLRAAAVVAVLLAGSCTLSRAATGAELFATHCQACHQAAGEGTPGIAPPLAGTLARRAALPEGRDWLVQTLVSGLTGPITSLGEPYNGVMPSFAVLPDADVAALLGHVLTQFNGVTGPLPQPEDVAAARRRSVKASELRQQRTRLLVQAGE
jgi:mono/diheme cytochrome c family protein